MTIKFKEGQSIMTRGLKNDEKVLENWYIVLEDVSEELYSSLKERLDDRSVFEELEKSGHLNKLNILVSNI